MDFSSTPRYLATPPIRQTISVSALTPRYLATPPIRHTIWMMNKTPQTHQSKASLPRYRCISTWHVEHDLIDHPSLQNYETTINIYHSFQPNPSPLATSLHVLSDIRFGWWIRPFKPIKGRPRYLATSVFQHDMLSTTLRPPLATKLRNYDKHIP